MRNKNDMVVGENSKILLFGSFTEDETRHWKEKPPGILSRQENTKVSIQRNRKKDKQNIGSYSPVNSCQGEIENFRNDCDNGINNCFDIVTEMTKLEIMPEHPLNQNDNGNISSSTQFYYNENDGTCKFDLNHSDLREDKFKVLDVSTNILSENASSSPHGRVICSACVRPRGLINVGNLCFLNATLQALLSCSQFVELLWDLKTRNIPEVGFPTLNAFMELISSLDVLSDENSNEEDSIHNISSPLCPNMFESVLKIFTPDVTNNKSGRPRQEDAQEFLSFIMDKIHDELLQLQAKNSGRNVENISLISFSGDDEWETVGRKNKTSITRTQSFVPSELCSIFGGQLKSVVKASGNKASATIQPYLLLHLDIFPSSVCSILDALHLFIVPETLEGYRATIVGKGCVVAAKKFLQIQTLPRILILHLMRFRYGSRGSIKLNKPVRFPLDLSLPRDLLVSPSTEGRQYELVATITHHGSEPSKGHYTADACYPNSHWLRFDDASITAITVPMVLRQHAYVLFYKQV